MKEYFKLNTDKPNMKYKYQHDNTDWSSDNNMQNFDALHNSDLIQYSQAQ